MTSVSIEIGDLEYELEVTHYEAGSPPSGWDPGAGWEVELSDTVKICGSKEKIKLKEFIAIYADYSSVSLDRAEQKLLEEVYEDVTEQYADDYDDRDRDDDY